MQINPGPAITSSSLNLRRHDLVFPVSFLFRVPSAPMISPECCGSSTAGPSDPGAISCAEASGLPIATSHPLIDQPTLTLKVAGRALRHLPSPEETTVLTWIGTMTCWL